MSVATAISILYAVAQAFDVPADLIAVIDVRITRAQTTPIVGARLAAADLMRRARVRYRVAAAILGYTDSNTVYLAACAARKRCAADAEFARHYEAAEALAWPELRGSAVERRHYRRTH